MVFSRNAAILEAEKALEEFKSEYPERLRKTLDSMNQAANNARYERLAALAHDLKGEAGTVGWPLVSQASGWLRQTIEAADGDPDPRIVDVFMQSIRRLAEPDLVGETEEGVTLIKELYALCVSKHIKPS